MELLTPGRTALMGVLNTTPDSFSDGGRYHSLEAAVGRAREMVDEGADLIDVGGESTRPGASEVSVDEEIRRTAPVIERIGALGVPVSIDTRKATVAKAALDAGAVMVNDVSGGTFDPAMPPLAADRRVPVVLMHTRGTPQTMDSLASYGDVVAEVRSELAERVAAARHAGVEENRILLDPGLGFAKTPEQSLELLRRIDELHQDGFPLVVGPSRKRFVGHVLGTEVEDRLEGTLAAVAWCAAHGVAVVRVHDVRAVRRVVDMTEAIRG
ncbi:MAG: dihydropteroate synthase, partial [Candidatus Binatia bacterium]